jgi:hypothetical protein
MAGLNNLISNTSQQTTTLPGWFDTAQQNVATQAGNAFGAAPAPQNTVGQQAVNALSGPTNAFTQAGGTLQSIASGAANPWLTSPSGEVTPNTQTALGGLFQAQNQQLNQLLPNATAPAQANAIGSGNFGSLRGQTAVDKAKADAFANLNTQQFQAALQNQATGVNAAQGAGNVGQQNINNLLTTGQYQQAAPFTNVSNYGKVLGGIQAPTTVNNQTQLSPLNQVAGLVQALGGQSGSTGILGALGIPGGLTGLVNSAKTLFGNIGGNPAAGSNISGGYGQGQGGAGLTPNPDGTFTNSNGDIISASGEKISTGTGPTYNAGSDTNNQPIPDYTGPAITNNPTNMGGADYADQGYGIGQ